MKKSKNLCKTIILCGGRGKRLGKIGENIPKPLVKLREKSILYHKLSQGISQGFSEFIIAIGYKGSMIVDACRKMDLKFNVDYSESGEHEGMMRINYDAS
ncbi:MAG: sugar phosphate nucleotidyltransferase, partial [Candidatus Omnitrophota bacterium]